MAQESNAADTAEAAEAARTVVVIAGVRGSGRTLSLRLLEDTGYTGIDNLPPSVLPQLVDDMSRDPYANSLVVVAETRTAGAVEDLLKAIAALRRSSCTLKVFFLDASESTLVRRLGLHGGDRSGLMENRHLTNPLRKVADRIIDTSSVTPAVMKERLSVAISGTSLNRTMKIDICSFGFKYAPFNGDMVFDVRFIPNPYYVTELRPLTGKDRACADFVFASDMAETFVDTIGTLIQDLIPAYIKQGRSEIRIGIGCTGGHHRSVAVAEALGRLLGDNAGTVTVSHRELSKHD